MPSASPGLTETGAPSFVVLGPEALGLSSAPTDLHHLPDGRVLVTSKYEIAFGDGVRWEVHRAADSLHVLNRVAIDRDGTIYAGIAGAFARIDFGEDGRWRAMPVAHLPAGTPVANSTMISVWQIGERWLWFGGAGAIVSWRPGESIRLLGNVSFSIERIFAAGDDVFVSDQSSGGLFRLGPNDTIEPANTTAALASETVTSALTYGPGETLVGTASSGLQIFNGQHFRSLGGATLLGGGTRISDLCETTSGLYAAAVDTAGVVFFDRSGRTVQVLDRGLDHRLARVRKLQYAANGVLWALLNEGVARVQFPSPISHFEPLLASGLVYAKPLRHEGRLWVLADGRAVRGVYDDDGRLEGFEPDTPSGRFLFTLGDVDGHLMASNEAGIHVRESAGWKLVLPGIVNARLGVARSQPHGSLYVARGEYGFIQRTADGYVAHRISAPELGDNYNGIEDAAGIAWFELGTSRVARIDPRTNPPTFEILGRAEGLSDGWVESYVLDGVARFHLPGRLFRFDETTRQFVDDRELLGQYPQFQHTVGRPVADRSGRLWFTVDGGMHLIDRRAPGPAVATRIALGFAPTEYNVEENGVVWMFENRRFARLDPSFPAAPSPPLRALLTSLQLAADNRLVFQPQGPIALPYADNSLVFHFAAPANPFGTPVTFEVQLEGANTQWVSTGAVGSATFNRLNEGDYVFRVRPVAGGTERGAEARLAFTILPPWYRTKLAWAVYSASAIGLFAFAAWLSSFLQRRENERLEKLVAVRTKELNATNFQLGRQIEETTEKSAALAASEERYRKLNTELETRVQERTAELSRSNEELAQRESLFRLIFEHAPVGISWKRADLGDVYHFNSTYRRILGLPEGTATDARLLSTFVHPDDAPHQAEMNRQIATGERDSYDLEQRLVLKDGRMVWGSLSVAVIRDRSGRIVQDIALLEDITARKQAEEKLANTYKNLLETSRMAGMAEVATAVLHNVGNVLNSLNVSAGVVASGVRRSKADGLAKLSSLLNEHANDLGTFFAHDPKAKLVPGYVNTLAENLLGERDWLLDEIASMQKNIDHIKEIVAMQQGYARAGGVVETLEAPALFEDALRIAANGSERGNIKLERNFLPVPPLTVEKGKVLQILVNLIRNAKLACDEAAPNGEREKVIALRIAPGDKPDTVQLVVRDNGVGIAAENLTRIFAHGFTTRTQGHGFGLHASALAAKEMKGSLTVSSAGPGQGAAFTLELPIARKV